MHTHELWLFSRQHINAKIVCCFFGAEGVYVVGFVLIRHSCHLILTNIADTYTYTTCYLCLKIN
jgi:hypothetical protein